MKNLLYFPILFCAVLFIFSCTPCPDCPDVTMDQYDDTATLRDTISVATFQTWRNNWLTNGQSYTANTLTKYFTMPVLDLTEFLEFPGTGRDSVVAARFVLGMEIDATDSIPHLMLVGVNSAGQSLIDTSKQQYIYDVTKPCPKMCGLNSLPDRN